MMAYRGVLTAINQAGSSCRCSWLIVRIPAAGFADGVVKTVNHRSNQVVAPLKILLVFRYTLMNRTGVIGFSCAE